MHLMSGYWGEEGEAECLMSIEMIQAVFRLQAKARLASLCLKLQLAQHVGERHMLLRAWAAAEKRHALPQRCRS